MTLLTGREPLEVLVYADETEALLIRRGKGLHVKRTVTGDGAIEEAIRNCVPRVSRANGPFAEAGAPVVSDVAGECVTSVWASLEELDDLLASDHDVLVVSNHHLGHAIQAAAKRAALGLRTTQLALRIGGALVVSPLFGKGGPCVDCWIHDLSAQFPGLSLLLDCEIVHHLRVGEGVGPTLSEVVGFARWAQAADEVGPTKYLVLDLSRMTIDLGEAVCQCGSLRRQQVERRVHGLVDDSFCILEVSNGRSSGAACDLEPRRARLRARAEQAEREDLLRSPEAGGQHITVEGDWRPCHGDDYAKVSSRYVAFGDEDRAWLPARRLMDGQERMLPVAEFSLCNLAEKPYRPRSSTGTAFGNNLVDATRRAVLELVERDRVVRDWCNGKFSKLDGLERTAYFRAANRSSLDLDLALLAYRHAFVIVAGVRTPEGSGCLGAAAGFEFGPTCDHAIADAVLTFAGQLRRGVSFNYSFDCSAVVCPDEVLTTHAPSWSGVLDDYDPYIAELGRSDDHVTVSATSSTAVDLPMDSGLCSVLASIADVDRLKDATNRMKG